MTLTERIERYEKAGVATVFDDSKMELIELLKELRNFREKEDANGCTWCAFEEKEEWDLPCSKCKLNCKNYWRRKA